MFKKGLYILFLIVTVTFTSCDNYEKVLKCDDYELKYRRAIEYYNHEDYDKAMGLFEQLVPVYTATRKADTINFYLAKCNYHSQDYILAAYNFSEFSRTYGNSPFVEEADFLEAYSYYLSSPRPSLDQDYTYKAIQAFQIFLSRHPGSVRTADCNNYITLLTEKLVEKSYEGAKLYFNLGEYKSAIVALSNSLTKFPTSKYREEMMFLILKARYLYALNSYYVKQSERFQATIDEYYTFISEYTSSKYLTEAQKIFEESKKHTN